MSDYLRSYQQAQSLSDAELRALHCCEYLKAHSDVFCPVMQELLPLTKAQHTHLVLQTMLELGFKVELPSLTLEQQYGRENLATLRDAGFDL
jgi:hypothetical protein